MALLFAAASAVDLSPAPRRGDEDDVEVVERDECEEECRRPPRLPRPLRWWWRSRDECDNASRDLLLSE